MKTILVTGAGGYIGSTLVGYFLDAGYHVKALDRFFFGTDTLDTYAHHPYFELIRHDIRSCPESMLAGVYAVIDLAGLSNDPSSELDPHLTEEINQKGPVHIAAMAKNVDVKRYLFASSCSVYGHGTNITLTEDSPLAPVSLYAKAKIEAEKGLLALADENFMVTILRNATCYGLSPRMRFDIAVNLMTLHAYKNHKIIVMGGGEQWRPFVHIKDVARAYQLVLQADAQKIQRQIFNVGSNEQNYKISQLAHIIKNIFTGITVEHAPDDPDKRDYHVVFDKLSSVFGFKPEMNVKKGAEEIKRALEEGSVRDDLKTVTVKYYKYLLDADAVLNQVKHNGKLF